MGKYKNLLSNLGLFTLNAFATKLITFLLVPLYTYYLSQKDFGISDMSTTVISLILPLATLSISDAVLRFMIEDEVHKGEYANAGVALTIFSCLIVALLLPILNLPIFGGLGDYKLFFWLMYVTNSFQNLFSNCARGLNQIKLITVVSIISSLFTSCGAFILISIFKIGLIGYFISLISGGIVGVTLYIVVGKHYRYFRFIKKEHLFQLFGRMIPYAVPLIPNALFWWIGTSINRFFITSMLGISASGLFAATLKIPNLMNMVYSIFFQAWTLSAFQEFKKSNVQTFFTIIFRLLNAFMILAGAVITFLAPWLAKLFLQKDFFNGWPLIPVLVAAFYFNCLGSFFGTIFTADMRTRQILTTTVISGVVCALSTWLLIPIAGLYGAAVAMVLSNIVLFVTRVKASRRIIAVDISWPSYCISLALFTLQIILVSSQVNGFELYSGLITLLLIVWACIYLRREIGKIRLLIQKKTHHGRHIVS